MKAIEKYAAEVREFIGVCKRLAQTQYVTSSGGNLAWRLEDDLLLITPTKLYKGDINVQDLVFIDMNGKTMEGECKPTGETPMYLKFFGLRQDVRSVIHCHAPHVCAMAISGGENWLMRPIFPETTIEVGPVPLVPYAEPLTERLAENFVPFLTKYNSFLMESHGLVTMSRGGIQETLMLTTWQFVPKVSRWSSRRRSSAVSAGLSRVETETRRNLAYSIFPGNLWSRYAPLRAFGATRPPWPVHI